MKHGTRPAPEKVFGCRLKKKDKGTRGSTWGQRRVNPRDSTLSESGGRWDPNRLPRRQQESHTGEERQGMTGTGGRGR